MEQREAAAEEKEAVAQTSVSVLVSQRERLVQAAAQLEAREASIETSMLAILAAADEKLTATRNVASPAAQRCHHKRLFGVCLYSHKCCHSTFTLMLLSI